MIQSEPAMRIRKRRSTRSRSKLLAKSRRKRNGNERKRTSCADSVDSLESKSIYVDEEPGRVLKEDRELYEEPGDIRKDSAAQVIPFQHLDEWSLFILLEKRFGPNKFKIEVSPPSLVSEYTMTDIAAARL